MKSGSWFIQLRLDGESIPVTARTEKGCTRQAQYLKAEYKAGKRRSPDPAETKLPTLGEAIDAYIAKRDAVLSPSTIRGYNDDLEKQVCLPYGCVFIGPHGHGVAGGLQQEGKALFSQDTEKRLGIYRVRSAGGHGAAAPAGEAPASRTISPP